MATTNQREIFLHNEAETLRFGRLIGEICRGGEIMYLNGCLGAGKTTFCRGVLQAYGHSAPVKSPTYTLVEPYVFNRTAIYHFDLYRLGDPEELEYMGIRDYFDGKSTSLIEWPEKGMGMLALPDLTLSFRVSAASRTVRVQYHSDCGEKLLNALSWSPEEK